MRVQRVSLNIWFEISLSIALICMVNAQLCPPITVGDLGSTTNFSDVGLVPSAATPAGEAVDSIPVRIMDYTIVCDASGMNRNTSSFVSVLVQFQCDFTSGTGTLADCDGNTNVTRQYQFSCISREWNAVISGNDLFVQTLNPTATLMTPLDNQCRRCIDDQQSTNPNIDDTTHCDPCGAQCNLGQGRCFFNLSGDQCCNFYLQGVCVPECPSALTSDANFDCVCPTLNLTNGVVSYSSVNRDVGSVAIHTCHSGYRLSPQGGETRTCTSSIGWDGESVTCEFIECDDRTIANGVVTINPLDRRLNSVATYTCDENFALKGDPASVCRMDSTWNNTVPECEESCGGCGPGTCNLVIGKCECPTGFIGDHCSIDCSKALDDDSNCLRCGLDGSNVPICVECKDGFVLRNGKCEIAGSTDASTSSCNTGCIIGIVLAILGAIILSIVVALVVYAVYRYLSDPATKLAKAGTEGLNGVARDNPLYLPPEEIVGDVGDVETA